MAEEETLVSRRSKRSTAGNRMEAALAELAVEEINEAEEDIDFVNDKDEEDIFESDFASTDEEAAAEDVDTGEKAVEDEEKRARRSARVKVEKATAAAHARQKVTFHPQAEAPAGKKPNKEAQKLKRRVSLGVAVNAETGEVIEGGTRQRQSQRSHTIMNTSATVNRMKDAEEKRATIPKKARIVTKAPTQDELIARALDTEEGNIIEHRDYLKLEEEKRARARVVRTALEGPVLRWISRKEQVKVEVMPPAPSPAQYPSQYGFVYNPHQGTSYSGTQTYHSPFRAYVPAQPNAIQAPEASSAASQGLAATSQPQLQPSTPSANIPSQPSYYYYPVQPPPALPPAQERVDNVCRNYVVHELSQEPSAAKPPWKDTMSAMFGDEVKWDEVRVFTGKQRPLSRPVRTCPITGTPANYLDPRTNVPFANVAAFKTLTKILSHDYVWSEALGCYVTRHEKPNNDVDEPMDGTTTKRRRVDDQDAQVNDG
ncbi:YL1 nuclear protein-domain-containing protein [Suillus paluster]|uniref:YL1 nuclear protein-domain-containing protein n=1 Tax=Suillus paluster TaxID=48578 RepID=UPI001B864B92|nr:YL1 nuclear protein-domain-containing protein [Suillus paluster]KAG1741783.1 YL1 nuclear protein-domain-containing protein [Suillus paluster]